jgi:hypothetical protein
MNLLEFPNEILFEFCKHMDFRTRVNFRKSCKQTYSLLNNPKDKVSKEMMNEWMEKMKIVIGMTLLDNLIHPVILRSLSKNIGRIQLCIDDSFEFFLTFNHHATSFIRNLMISSGHEIVADGNGTISSQQGQGNSLLFTKYKLDKFRNIFDHKESISKILYDLYISFVCEDQNKNKQKITQNHIASLVKIIINEPIQFYNTSKGIFRSSVYFSFPDESDDTSLFRTNIQNIVNELQKDQSRYFMDGTEAQYFFESFH